MNKKASLVAWTALLCLLLLFAWGIHVNADDLPFASSSIPPTAIPTDIPTDTPVIIPTTAPPTLQRPTSTPVMLATVTPRPEPRALPPETGNARPARPDNALPLMREDGELLIDQVLSPVTWVLDMSFVDEDYGWALGRSTLCAQQRECPIAMSATTDGGQTWQTIAAPDTIQAGSILPGGVEHLRFASRAVGWVFGPGLFATTDGGQTWVEHQRNGEIIALEPAGESVWAIERVCSNTVPDECELRLLAATLQPADAASVWQYTSAQPPFQGNGARLVRADAQHAWIIHQGGLMTTRDGGESWRELPTSTNRCTAESIHITRLVAYDPANLWMLCNGQGPDGLMARYLYTSFDGGEAWYLVAVAREDEPGNLPMNGYPNDLAVPAAGRAFIALLGDTLIGSSDGGMTWDAAIPRDTASQEQSGASRVYFADEQHGWALLGERIFRTLDGGSMWSLAAQVPLGASDTAPPTN